MSKTGIPKYCDSRAEKFFSWCFKGKGRKDANSSGYGYSWNSSHEDLKPTPSFQIAYDKYCPYCLNKMYPIQADLINRRVYSYNSYNEDYEVTGHTCVCKKAMGWLQWQKEREDLKNIHVLELEELDEKYKDISPNMKRIRSKLAIELKTNNLFYESVLENNNIMQLQE